MECYRIRNCLSEYVDGFLGAETVTMVEEHIKKCGECNKEHAEYISLKSLINKVGSMGNQKAPEDFLQKVHERIRSRSLFMNLREILFFPARIKVPMELASLAVIALLIFTVFNMLTPEKQVIFESPGPNKPEITIKPEISAESITNGTGELLLPWEEGSLIHLALSLKTEQTANILPSENVLFVNSGNSAGGADISGFGYTTEQPAQKMELVDALISDIYEMISLEEGRLLLKEYKNGTDYPEYITLEIPGTNYSPFLKRIENIGTLQTPAPNLPNDYQKRISIKIHLIQPE